MEIETAQIDACNIIWDINYGGGCVNIYRLRNRVCVSVIKDIRNASKVRTAYAEPRGRDSYSYWVGLDVALRKALNKRLPPYIIEKNNPLK